MSLQDFVGSMPAVITAIIAALAIFESMRSDRPIGFVFAYLILTAVGICFIIWQARLTGEERGKRDAEIKELSKDIKEIKTLIYQSPSAAVIQKWSEVELKNIPAPIADYIYLLFSSDKGRIIGKVRIKGSREEYPFSTTANNRIPIAIRNVWLPREQQYKSPAFLEFLITETTEPSARLSIYTQGFYFSRGQEHH